ncbi:MAG TPA: CopG family transcriptional regulator [Tissierellaceae bacterium]|nr:CopG family transcriptional regulator [Tissierellaceae bacterium]
MVEKNLIVPMKCNGTIKVIRECVKVYFKDIWTQDMNENLKHGYKEMSRINLNLAESGLEQDNSDLYNYESVLIGREKL